MKVISLIWFNTPPSVFLLQWL